MCQPMPAFQVVLRERERAFIPASWLPFVNARALPCLLFAFKPIGWTRSACPRACPIWVGSLMIRVARHNSNKTTLVVWQIILIFWNIMGVDICHGK